MNKKGVVLLGSAIIGAIVGLVVYVGVTEGLPKPNWNNSSVTNPSPHLNYDHLGGGR